MSKTRKSLSLDGGWNFTLDRADIGLAESWQGRDFDGAIQIPGSWQEKGYGDPPPSQWLGMWTSDHVYEGAAWYTRTVDVPADWRGQTVELVARGVRWGSDLWIDGQHVGHEESLSTPHRFDLTALLKPGSTQRITLRVDNRMLYSLRESHANSEQTATRWGGVTGGIDLIARPAVAIERVTCVPDVAARSFTFVVTVSGAGIADALVTDPQTGASFVGSAAVADGSAEITVELDASARLWWDDDPFLYDVEFNLRDGTMILDTAQKRVGLREFTVEGRKFLLNGRPTFLRGYVDCCIFPQTGYPPWDVDEYRRQLRIAREYGFNHVRLHSWTAPEPFFQAADELGMLAQTELPNWTAHYGHREIDTPADVQDYLTRELERIVAELQLHPSWVMFSNGNELIYGGDGHPRLLELAARGKALDPTRLFTDNTGFGQLPAPGRQVDFYIQSCNWHPPKKIYDAATNNTTEDFSAVAAQADRPLVGHEHGQFTMYVRPQEATLYKGSIKPAWLDAVNETLAVKNLTQRVDDFIQASGTHSARTYKENIERARRTRGLSGLQLLDIRDFPGQGHATTGLLDMFWNSKGLIEADVFAAFNSAIVPLMRAASPTFWTGELLVVDLELSNFGRESVSGPLRWTLTDRASGQATTGTLPILPAPVGALTPLGRLEIPTPSDGQPHAWELTVEIGAGRNAWHLWSFPYPTVPSDDSAISCRIQGFRNALPHADFADDFSGIQMKIRDVYWGLSGARKLAISDRLSLRLLQYLIDGGSVWLMPGLDQLYDAVRTRYLPPFWSYLHFPDNVSSVMGMIVPQHPALGRFPHDGFSDWQWYELVNNTPAICLDSVPTVEPVVEVVDNFNRAKRLAYAFEARVGAGRLFVSTFRLYDPKVAGRPEARFLFNEVLTYLRGEAFAPSAALSVGRVLGLLRLTNSDNFGLE